MSELLLEGVLPNWLTSRFQALETQRLGADCKRFAANLRFFGMEGGRHARDLNIAILPLLILMLKSDFQFSLPVFISTSI